MSCCETSPSAARAARGGGARAAGAAPTAQTGAGQASWEGRSRAARTTARPPRRQRGRSLSRRDAAARAQRRARKLNARSRRRSITPRMTAGRAQPGSKVHLSRVKRRADRHRRSETIRRPSPSMPAARPRLTSRPLRALGPQDLASGQRIACPPRVERGRRWLGEPARERFQQARERRWITSLAASPSVAAVSRSSGGRSSRRTAAFSADPEHRPALLRASPR